MFAAKKRKMRKKHEILLCFLRLFVAKRDESFVAFLSS